MVFWMLKEGDLNYLHVSPKLLKNIYFPEKKFYYTRIALKKFQIPRKNIKVHFRENFELFEREPRRDKTRDILYNLTAGFEGCLIITLNSSNHLPNKNFQKHTWT